jgi:PAS domain S-box-containing protein
MSTQTQIDQLIRIGPIANSIAINLSQSEELFRAYVETANDMVYTVDLAGKLTFINTYGQKLLGCPAAEIIGRSYLDFVAEPFRAQTAQAFGNLMQIGELRDFEFVLQPLKGQEVYLEVNGRLLYRDGELIGGIGIGRDITERKRITAELAAKNEELNRANHLKSEFLATMSHELRTPLTGILGFSSILQQQLYGNLNPKQLDYTQKIHQSGQHLLTLINALLDLSKIEAGQMLLDIHAIVVDEICWAALGMISTQAEARNLTVERSIPADLPALYADPLRMRQMLVNLLSNAVKFTPPGGTIGIAVETVHDTLQITVWDTGIGIATDKQHLLFQPFQQIDGSLTRRHEGTGLGLALTRKLAELHHGTVTVASQEGKGSQFTISLPIQGVPM